MVENCVRTNDGFYKYELTGKRFRKCIGVVIFTIIIHNNKIHVNKYTNNNCVFDSGRLVILIKDILGEYDLL